MWIIFFAGLSSAALAGLFVDASTIPWRAIEVGSILAGSLAIVTVFSEWRKLQAGNQIGHLRRRVFTALLTLDSVASNYLSIVRFRISNEASNLEQYKSTLPWFERIAALAKVDEAIEPESVLDQAHDFPEGVDDKEIVTLRDEILSIAGRQEKALKTYREKKQKIENSLLDEFTIFFMPFFATLALSLALFKALYQP